MDPAAVRYSRFHEWVGLDGEVAVVGISDHAQQTLGDITFVELPQVGRRVRAGDMLAVVESVKSASEIVSPVAGTVAAVNGALAEAPERINADPFGQGWLCKLTGVAATDQEPLMSRVEYDAFLKRQA